MKCVECFKPLEKGHICDRCQNLLSNLTDVELGLGSDLFRHFAGAMAPDQEENDADK